MIRTRILFAYRLLLLLVLLISPFGNIGAQSVCDPKSIVGFWKSNPSFFDRLLGFDRIWAFSKDGKVQIYLPNHETKKYELNGEAEYHLDNVFQPRKVVVTNSNFGDAFNGGATFEFELVTLSENYFDWVPLLQWFVKKSA